MAQLMITLLLALAAGLVFIRPPNLLYAFLLATGLSGEQGVPMMGRGGTTWAVGLGRSKLKFSSGGRDNPGDVLPRRLNRLNRGRHLFPPLQLM
jgi:hypothetical protein